MTTDTPAIDLIVHLESYTESHISASSSLKSAVWDLNKARRQRGRNLMTIGTAFSALDIREELRAQTYVEYLREEPPLEDEDGLRKYSCGTQGSYVLRSYIQLKENDLSADVKNNQSEGIRQRRSKKEVKPQSSTAGKWSEENFKDEEEEKLRSTNPLDLFGGGLVPRDLKLAQKHAKESLASYIAAANEVAAIMRLIEGKLEKNAEGQKEDIE